MDKTIQELVKSCRPFLSKRTKFLHYDTPEVVPFYENLCFALALMRLKEKESFLEGKELYERLQNFKVGDTFPALMHEYPKCYGKKDFKKVVQAIGDFEAVPQEDYSGFYEDWRPFQHYLKEGIATHQEGFELKRTLLDQTLAYLHDMPPVKMSPEFLELVLIKPLHVPFTPESADPLWVKGIAEPKQPTYTLFWKKNKIESLAVFTAGTLEKSDNTFTLTLPAAQVQDENELVFYINRDTNPQFWSRGKRVTAFTLDKPLEIKTDVINMKLEFGSGIPVNQFYGHIAYNNRPNQLLQNGESFDQSIAIRTVRRDGPITLHFKISH